MLREFGADPAFVLTLTCPERPRIVHAATSVLVAKGCDIIEHQQFDDSMHGLLFLRTSFLSPRAGYDDMAQSSPRLQPSTA